MIRRFAAVLCLVAATSAVRADWPARVFAPYLYLGQADGLKITDCHDATGVKHYTLAFIIARQERTGNAVTYLPEASWDGRVRIEQNLYKDQVDAIRQRGGDVVVSFGGEGGREIAIVIEDPVALEAAYQSVIDRYGLTWLDFDIEGNNLEKNPLASQRRNTVLASLQRKNPNLRITYTLPVDPNGLSPASRALLADATAKGVKVHAANLMVMYFGKAFINKGRSEGQLGIDSARSAHAQIQKIDPSVKIGLCPCLGNNGSKDEVFTPEDAKVLKAFADETPWVCSLHFWSINDDAGRQRDRDPGSGNPKSAVQQPRPWTFADLFKSFESPQR